VTSYITYTTKFVKLFETATGAFAKLLAVKGGAKAWSNNPGMRKV